MGITSTTTSSPLQKSKRFSLMSYSYLDKLLFIELQFMNNSLSESDVIKDFPYLPHQQFLNEREDKTKQRRFTKWFKMAYQLNDNSFQQLSVDSIRQSIEKEHHDELRQSLGSVDSCEREPEISLCEQGLRAYYLTNPSRFEERVVKGPPSSFRWLSWLISAGIPINRPSDRYIKLLSFDLDKEAEDQIQKDITRTLGDSKSNTLNIQNKLYRLLKSIALLDKEMSYVQGINFLCGFFLFVSNSNEIDTFYCLIGLFSMTFSFKFGMRDFYTDRFPLIRVCTTIFEANLQKKFPKLREHINRIQLPSLCWVDPWMQTLFVNVFPNAEVLRIWDAFFVHGIPFLISFALGVTELLHDVVLCINDAVQVNEYFKLLNPNGKNSYRGKQKEIAYDINKLIERALSAYPIDLGEIDELLSREFPDVKREVAYNYKHVNDYLDAKLNNLNLKERTDIVQCDAISFTTENQSKIELVNGGNGKEGIQVKGLDDSEDDFTVDEESNLDETSNHMKELHQKNKTTVGRRSYEF